MDLLLKHCPRFRRRHSSRSGIAVLWLILALFVIALALCFVVEIANLWLARAELENSLESAALAAVKHWGDASVPSNTADARQVGIEFAAANTVGGLPVAITSNRDVTAPINPNENDDPTNGDLIFGAITSTEPQVVFDANATAGCGLGDVEIHAFGEREPGGPTSSSKITWSIIFNNPPGTPANLTIHTVLIDLLPPGNTDPFNDATFDATPTNVIVLPLGAVVSPITFTPPSPVPPQPTLQVNFPNTSTGNDFQPGETVNFDAKVNQLSTGTGRNDGDGVGRIGVAVTVTFAIGGVDQPPVTAIFIDTNFLDTGDGNGDEESIAYINGEGGNKPAVRAQKQLTVPSITGSVFGLYGPFTVCAHADAMYDCVQKRPILIRVDEFLPP